MELFALLIDFILHIDRYIETFVRQYGVLVYGLLFLIVFVETGLVADDGWVELTAGLAVGEAVAVRGVDALRDGTQVVVR
jgi:hypothetical protein